MALGSRRKSGDDAATTAAATEAAASDAASTTPTAGPASPPVAPLFAAPSEAPASKGGKAAPAGDHPEASDAEVAELRTAVSDLQALVNSLVERSLPSAGSEAETASRIIVAANDAAELAVTTAKTEAEEMIASAKAKSYEIIGVARDLANSELAAERARVATATETWNTRRTEITERLTALQGSIGAYQSDLAAAAEAVTAAIGLLDLDPATDSGTDAADHADTASTEAADTASTDAPKVDSDVTAEAADAADATTATLAPLPQPGDGSKRSNLFGGSGARAAAAAGATASATAEPPLRAGMFGR